jgi:hypothetical protein
VIGPKGTLVAADAKLVEDRFQQKLVAFSSFPSAFGYGAKDF